MVSLKSPRAKEEESHEALEGKASVLDANTRELHFSPGRKEKKQRKLASGGRNLIMHRPSPVVPP